MSVTPGLSSQKSRLGALLDHFATIDDPRDVRRIAHPLAEVLLLVVCGTIADCDDYDHIAAWGDAHLDFLRRHLPYEHGIPGGPLADHSDEPYQPGPVLGRLHRLGVRDLARTPGVRHLAGLVWHGLLAEHQAARGGEGRNEVERCAAVGAVVAAARGLSIDGRLVVTVTAAFSARMVDIGPPLVPIPSSFCTTQWCVV